MSSPHPASKRGSTNLLTGTVRLLDLPSSALFKHVLKGRLPPAFLPPFLHEATHFWCMATDLGAALALLEMRAHREVMLKTYQPERLCRDMAVTQSTHMLLKPLLEGMALFMEFDSAPGSSDVWASPGLWAGLIFTPVDEDPPERMDPATALEWLSRRVYDALIHYRDSPVAANRKTEVLMQPIDEDPEFYLIGYLALKQIWLTAMRHTDAFMDRDLFLSFLHNWIFQDWVLIECLLDESLSAVATLYLISERLQKRLVELATSDLSAEAAEFNRVVGANLTDREATLRYSRLKESQVRAGHDRIEPLVNELHEGMTGENENYYFSDFVTLQHRQQMLRLAAEEVEIEVNEHDRVIVRRGSEVTGIYMSGPAPKGAERGVTNGWMTVYYLPAYRSMVALAVRHNQPMIWTPVRDLPDDLFTLLKFAATKVAYTEHARGGLTALCREIADGHAGEDYNNAVDGMPEHVRKIYRGYALSATPADCEEEVARILERRGLYDLLDKDGDVLTALVHISLYPLLDKDMIPLVRDRLRKLDIDLDRSLACIREIQTRTGLPMLIDTPDATWCVV